MTIVVAWANLGPLEYLRPTLEVQRECMKTRETRVIIVDTSITEGVLTQEDQERFQTDIFPEFEPNGVKALITVLPQSALSRLAARQWMRTGSQFGVEFIDVDILETALNVAKDYT